MNELLEQFREPACPADLWPDKPVTVANLIRLCIENKWLESAVPFGRTLRGPNAVWKETLQLTESGTRAIN